MSVLVDQRIKNAGRKNSPVSHSALGKDNSLDGRLSLTEFISFLCIFELLPRFFIFSYNVH